MISYADFVAFSNQEVTEEEFNKVRERATDILSALCGSLWKENEISDKAVMYQCEFIFQLGGLDAWTNGTGSVQSRSYSVGGESESITYAQESISIRKFYNGLEIAPMSWSLLHANRMASRIGRVKTW